MEINKPHNTTDVFFFRILDCFHHVSSPKKNPVVNCLGGQNTAVLQKSSATHMDED